MAGGGVAEKIIPAQNYLGRRIRHLWKSFMFSKRRTGPGPVAMRAVLHLVVYLDLRTPYLINNSVNI